MRVFYIIILYGIFKGLKVYVFFLSTYTALVVWFKLVWTRDSPSLAWACVTVSACCDDVIS